MAAQDLSMAVNIPPNAPPHVYAAAAEQSLEWGRPDGALQVCELGLSRHPAYYGLRLFRAEAMLQRKKAELAEEDLRVVLAAEPLHPRAIRLLAFILMDQRRYKEAIPILERAEFILMDDTDIPEWLRLAEAGAAEQESEALAPKSFLFSAVVSERYSEFCKMPGIKAVSLRDEIDERLGGPDVDECRLPLERMAGLEQRMADVLLHAGFGKLTDACVQERDVTWTTRVGAKATLRVASESRIREGLVSWHGKKVLGEVAE